MTRPAAQLALLIAADRVVAAWEQADSVAGTTFPLGPDQASLGDEEFGHWLKSRLRDTGAVGKRCIIALDRSDVLVKRLSFGAVPDDPSDLTNMVGLAVTRQMVAPPGGLRVDYLRSERPNDPSALAAAVSGERIEGVLRVARATGLQVSRVSPLSCGYTAIARSVARGGDGARLIIAPSAAGAEFLIVDTGEIMLSRWVAAPTGESTAEAVGNRWIALEARRTLMSHSADAGARPVSACGVIGYGDPATSLCAAVTEITGLSCDAIGSDQGFAGAEGDAAGIGLAGLLAEGHSGLAVIDLAHPRKPVDKSARRRQFAMAAAFGLIVIVGGVFTYGSLQLSQAKQRLEGLQTLHAEQSAARLEAVREVARLDHILRWQDASPDWLAHLATIGEVTPTGDGIVRELRATAVRQPLAYAKKGGSYDPKAWNSDPSISLVVKGFARSTDAAERLRGAFVDDARYTVFPAGQDGIPAKDPEYPVVFGMDLQSGGVARVLRAGGTR